MIEIIGFISFIVLAIILVKKKNDESYYEDYYGYSIVADNYIKRYRKAC